MIIIIISMIIQSLVKYLCVYNCAVNFARTGCRVSSRCENTVIQTSKEKDWFDFGTKFGTVLGHRELKGIMFYLNQFP